MFLYLWSDIHEIQVLDTRTSEKKSQQCKYWAAESTKERTLDYKVFGLSYLNPTPKISVQWIKSEYLQKMKN